ncbi:tetratricopeptide repeat protein [Quatrionicoccus australiensis]|nr:tetratricopeptide repeat protein [Quatrionicoccus australiensis]
MEQSDLKVDSLLAKGNQEEAIGVLADVAKKNPTRKEPWLRMAKAYFDAENYGQAIVASDEVLQRDSTDRTAKSILAVSGLRVATRSLTELRADAELRGNARSDAVSLAKALRETLQEDVLVPSADLEAKRKRDAAAKARMLANPRQKAVAPVANPTPASGGASGSDPFSVLK